MTKGVLYMTNILKEKINNMTANSFTEFLLPDIKISSDREAIIDGCYGVLEYNDTSVRINCKNLIIKFTGINLCIKTISEQQYTVKGKINCVEFLSF